MQFLTTGTNDDCDYYSYLPGHLLGSRPEWQTYGDDRNDCGLLMATELDGPSVDPDSNQVGAPQRWP